MRILKIVIQSYNMLTLYRRGASKGWSLYEYENLDNLIISELI